MAIASSFARSVLRSNTFRSSAAKFASEAKSTRSAFRFPKQKSLNSPIFRSPVEMSCCVESLMPYHTATASALFTSMLSVSHRYGWLSEGQDKTR
ncbi:hypothetical protein MKW92_034086 [Papaver armeniacum]|nr:hypothetical protein MKW92_034086 [Papaver armeniacum]